TAWAGAAMASVAIALAAVSLRLHSRSRVVRTGAPRGVRARATSGGADVVEDDGAPAPAACIAVSGADGGDERAVAGVPRRD
ncbi:hypothetical protein ABT314_43115, partial [Streptomyces spiralis]